MFVSDVMNDAKRAFENCGEDEIFRRLTDAVRLINNQGILDPNLGELSLCVCNGCVTLPRDVGTVLGINTAGQPTIIQDQWFQYHINGPGTQDCIPCGPNSYELGQFCTFRDPSEPCYLIAEVTSSTDNNKKLRVFALDAAGNKIFSTGPDGKLYEGFLVPMIFGFSTKAPNIPALTSIYRIQREATRDYVKLLAINSSDGISQTQIGYYEPDEILPWYRRIKVPNKTSVRIKYKKADLDVRSVRDYINIDNREALLLACRAVKYRMDDKWEQARMAEGEAVRILSNEAEAKKPSGPRTPQIINGVFNDNQDGMFYGSGGRDYGSNW